MENEEKRKLIRVFTKVTVEQVNVFEVPETSYEKIGKNEDGNDTYGYVETPNSKKKEESTELLYEQKFDEGSLDVKELALWANRIR